MATAECIHGFEVGFCDICFPRQTAEPVKPTRAAPVRRTPASGSSRAPSIVLATQRIYHVTHESNLPLITRDQALKAGATPAFDVSSPTTRELRAATELPHGGSVAGRVPFYLSPNAARWRQLRDGAHGAHWSDAARASSPLDFVVLVGDAGKIGADVVLTDKDAAASDARFAEGPESGTQQLRRMHATDPDFLEAEVLAAAAFHFTRISLIGVANERVRDRVKELLAETSKNHTPKVAVYPPWFTRE